MHSPKRARAQHQRDVSSSQPATTTSGCCRKVTIKNFPQFWPTLVHVCQIWRQIIFASQTLDLRLYCYYCKHGTPVPKTLACWPALPLVVQYGGSPTLEPPSLEDEDNVVAALKQSDCPIV